VVASGSGVQRAAGAAIAFAIVFAAPLAARAGAWTEPQGSGLLIETLFGWVGDGAPWGDNPAVKQNREDAQTYVEYGVTNELTIFGQTALERYALSPPTPDVYTGFDYSDIGLRAKLWSTGEWVFSGEATLFVPGAYDGAAPAQAGDTGGAGEARLLAGTNFTVGSTPAFFDGEFGYRLRTGGPPDEWHGGPDPRPQAGAGHDGDDPGLHDRFHRRDEPVVSGLEDVRRRGEHRDRARQSLVRAVRPVYQCSSGEDQHTARGCAGGVANVLTEGPPLPPADPGSHRRGINILLGGGQGRLLVSADIGEPLFPCRRVVRPLLHLDAPGRRLRGQEEDLALRGGEASRDGRFCS